MTTAQIVIGIILIVFAVFLIIAVLMQQGKSHNLSGTIAGGAEWETAYADQLPSGDLILNVGNAISWANSLIGRIDAAR